MYTNETIATTAAEITTTIATKTTITSKTTTTTTTTAAAARPQPLPFQSRPLPLLRLHLCHHRYYQRFHHQSKIHFPWVIATGLLGLLCFAKICKKDFLAIRFFNCIYRTCSFPNLLGLIRRSTFLYVNIIFLLTCV